MIENQDIRPAQVIGPLGEPLTLADLPSPDTRRWVVRRKAEVVAAVNGGLLTLAKRWRAMASRSRSSPRGSARSIARGCMVCGLPRSITIVISMSAS